MPKPTTSLGNQESPSATGKMIISVMKNFFGIDLAKIQKEGGLSVNEAIKIYNFNRSKLGVVSAAMNLSFLKDLANEQLTLALNQPEIAKFLAKILENKDFREQCRKDFEGRPELMKILAEASEGTECEDSIKYMLNPNHRPLPDSNKIATYPDKLEIEIDLSKMGLSFPWNRSQGDLEKRADLTAAAYKNVRSNSDYSKYLGYAENIARIPGVSKIATPLVRKLLEVKDFSETFNELMTNPKHAEFRESLKDDAKVSPRLLEIVKNAAKGTECENAVNSILSPAASKKAEVSIPNGLVPATSTAIPKKNSQEVENTAIATHADPISLYQLSQDTHQSSDIIRRETSEAQDLRINVAQDASPQAPKTVGDTNNESNVDMCAAVSTTSAPKKKEESSILKSIKRFMDGITSSNKKSVLSSAEQPKVETPNPTTNTESGPKK